MAGKILRIGEITVFVSQLCVCFLQVAWNRVVECSRNAIPVEVLDKTILVLYRYNKEMVDAACPVRLRLHLYFGVIYPGLVQFSYFPALVVPVVEVLQLYAERSTLKAAHAHVIAYLVMIIADY